MPRKILVLGATGRQGSATCRHLSARGDFSGVGITRDPGSEQAKRVAALPGIELARCDADVEGALEAVFQSHGPFHGVFSVQVNDYTEEGIAKELTQGKLVADLCEKHGVKHLIYTSFAELKPAVMPDGATKVEIEAYIRKGSVPFTMLRPAFFVENFFAAGFTAATATQIGYPGFDLRNDRAQHYIYTDDIGMIAVQVFAEGEPWHGESIDLVGDALAPAELVTVFAEHNGSPMQAKELPLDAFGEDVMPLFVFLRDEGWPDIDVAALRKRFPQLHTVKGALEHAGYRPPTG